jgi:phosphatidylinositol glycan class B
LDEYRDQTDVFYEDPLKYMQERFPNAVNEAFPVSPYPASVPGSPKEEEWSHSWPSHLVFFGSLVQEHAEIETMIEKLGYREVWSGRNGWEEDSRRRGGVRVWAYTSKGPLRL